jgi:hypothetical protein
VMTLRLILSQQLRQRLRLGQVQPLVEAVRAQRPGRHLPRRLTRRGARPKEVRYYGRPQISSNKHIALCLMTYKRVTTKAQK